MTYPASRRVGDLEITALLDAQGSFGPWAARFPGAGEDDWRRAREADPEAFGSDGTWRLSFRCYAIRRPDGRVILVDAGITLVDRVGPEVGAEDLEAGSGGGWGWGRGHRGPGVYETCRRRVTGVLRLHTQEHMQALVPEA